MAEEEPSARRPPAAPTPPPAPTAVPPSPVAPAPGQGPPAPAPFYAPPGPAAAAPLPGYGPPLAYGPPPYPQVPYGPYPYPPYGSPYPPAAPFPPPPANRAWPAQTAVGRMRMAALLGVGALVMGALLRVLESATGASDIPGSHVYAASTTEYAGLLLRGAELVLLGAALVAGGAALGPLRDSGKLLGEPTGAALRRGVGYLSGAATLAIAGTVGSWLYFQNLQQSMPGMGVISDPGLTRLFEQYRISLAISAACGAAASFVFVFGLERVWGRLLASEGRSRFAAFARVFTVAAAANVAMVFVVFFGLLGPPTLESPPSGAWAQGLLIVGPALAAASLLTFRQALGAIEARARALSKGPAPKASTPADP